MRLFKNQPAVATESEPLPFGGLGFSCDAVRSAAMFMVPVRSPQDISEPIMPEPNIPCQPSGYQLLVTLCREIRGR